MRIFAIGDIVGRPGREAVRKLLPKLREKYSFTLVIANAENSAGGSGITPAIAEELFAIGIDVLTSGDHIWKRKEIFPFLGTERRLLRPANYPLSAPGAGSVLIEKEGIKIGVLNLAGRIFMEGIRSPFEVGEAEVKRMRQETKIIVVDFHAEATSEKVALGWHLDGKVSAVFGTHTHIPTADEKILPQGTAYITDLGMSGPYDSVIGRRKEPVLYRFITQVPTRFEVAEGDVHLCGAVFEIEESTGKALSILRIDEKLNLE
ncbi:MAG: TIGR00282 family metallophosphoesterase [Candidatus Omnitrophota bacterium]|nr:MAG: TIGR00282 family metallophosphoesterase [Candidatus Omnitrophota bacterium]